LAGDRKEEGENNAKAQSRREENEWDSVLACRSMGILPMSAHRAFRGTSAEMPRGRFVRSERRAIILPSEHTVTGAGQTGKRNPPRGSSAASGSVPCVHRRCVNIFSAPDSTLRRCRQRSVFRSSASRTCAQGRRWALLKHPRDGSFPSAEILLDLLRRHCRLIACQFAGQGGDVGQRAVNAYPQRSRQRRAQG